MIHERSSGQHNADQETNPLIMYASMAGNVDTLLQWKDTLTQADRAALAASIRQNALGILRASELDVAVVAGSMKYLAKSKPTLATAMMHEFQAAALHMIAEKKGNKSTSKL